MENAISEYQKWKQHGEALRTQAKQAMETRFRELLTEAAQLAQEYHADFGGSLKPPANITAFRFKAGTKPKSKKTAKPQPKVELPPRKPDPKVAALQKRLAQAQKKLAAAKAAGSATKNLEDKIYEIEDELRLAASAS